MAFAKPTQPAPKKPEAKPTPKTAAKPATKEAPAKKDGLTAHEHTKRVQNTTKSKSRDNRDNRD